MIFFKSEKIVPKSGEEYRLLAFSALLGCILLLADQITKFEVAKRFAYGEALPVIDGFFFLTYVTNKGAAWSILSGYANLLLMIGLAVFAGAVIFFRRLYCGFAERALALALLLSGVAGNSIDRLWRGEVVDFLDFRFGSYHYPVFNIADCCICIGVALIMLSGLLRPEEKKDKESKDARK